jgi:hypothetical protein
MRDSRSVARPAEVVPHAVAALRRGRKAITAIEAELDEILVWVVDPSADIDFGAVDRLAASSREAGEALGCISSADIAGITSHALF